MGQVQVGLQAGYIMYWFTTPSEGHFNTTYNYSHNDYSIGILIRQRSLHKFNLGLEIQYANQSFAVKSTEPGLGGGGSVDYHYTIGNIYFKFQPQFVFGSKIKIFIYPGIYFGTLLNSSLYGTEYTWVMGQPPHTDTINGSAKGNYPSFEFGILLGFGIEVPIYKNLNFVYENNFSMNLLPVADWGSDKTKMLSLNFEIGLAYTFNRDKSKSSDK